MSQPNRLVHCFWEDLSPRAFAVVRSQNEVIYERLRKAGPWGPTNCDLACAVWRKAFSAAGVPVKLVSGNYYPTDGVGLLDWPTSSDHTWLIVDGAIFDPTASQFSHSIKPAYYRVGPPAGNAR